MRFDRRILARGKWKVYKVKPAMMYCLEMVALTKIPEIELEVAELKDSQIFIEIDQNEQDYK